MNRCTKAIIYKDNLEYNIKQILKVLAPGTKLCIAVKADSYGHNALLTSQIAEKLGVDYLAIATVDEGIELRKGGIKANLLLLSLAIPQEFNEIFEYEITPLVFGKEYINLISDAANKYFKKDETFNHLVLSGMCTHFAVSDSLNKKNQEFTQEQYTAFRNAVNFVKDKGIDPGICSCAASAAILNNPDMHFNMVRSGIITYGYYPDEITKDYLKSIKKDFDIKPVLAFETQVVAIRHFPKGKSISYGRTYVCKEDTDIAVLPVGYADGLLRRFSPGLEVTINGKNYPVCGRILM